MLTGLKCSACGEPLDLTIISLGTYCSVCSICGLESTFKKRSVFYVGDTVKLLYPFESHIAGDIGTVSAVSGFSIGRGYTFIPPMVVVRFPVESISEEFLGGCSIPDYCLTHVEGDK